MNPTFKGIGVAALLVFGLSPSFARGGESAAVRGRVIMESDSKPVANAEVRLVTWKDNNTRYDVKKAKSDERGEFVFENVGPGRHQLIAFYEDFASRQSRYKGEGVDLSAKEAVTLKLRKMPHIDVRVVSQSSDKPIEDEL